MKYQWICFIDAATIHVAADFRELVRTELPRLTLAFVPAGQTSFCQQLDMAFMKPFKDTLKRHAARECAVHLVTSLLAETPEKPMESVSLETKLPFMRRRLCEAVARAVDELPARENVHNSAWSNLHVTE